MKKVKNKINRKEKIFDAALQCFNQNGYYRTSMDTIAERAKMTKRGLYYHFKSKDQLFIKLFLYRWQKFFKQVDKNIHETNDSEERIKQFVKKSSTIIKENEDFLRFSIEFMSTGTRKPKIRQVMTDYYKDSNEIFKHFIDEGISVGELKKIDTEKIARIYFFLCIGAFFTFFSLNADFDLVDQHIFNVNYLINGLKKR